MVYGIICEFNPFHDGHRYLIEKTRKETGADKIVCIMSGSMVQRGDVAVFDKWSRARSAIEGGADLVVELPVSCVLQSADNFALGGVSILNAMGADGIAFGSECDDAHLLTDAAEIRISEPSGYKAALQNALESGMGYPAACHVALKSQMEFATDVMSMPNSTLAISYIKACKMLGSKMDVHVIKRKSEYHSEDIDAAVPSATAIRQDIRNNGKNSRFYSCTNGEIYDIMRLNALILGFFRMAAPESLFGISGMEPGLENRMILAAKNSSDTDEFVANCVTKRYTAHRIRRVILCSLLGIREYKLPRYARILAMNSGGAEVLKAVKSAGNIEIVVKAADVSAQNDDMLGKDILATDIAALCCGKRAGADYKNSPIVF